MREKRERIPDEEWKMLISGGVEMQLENFWMFTEPLGEGEPDIALNITPDSYTNGEDTRTISQLPRGKRLFIIRELMRQLRVNSKKLHEIEEYKVNTKKGDIIGKVFETGRKDEGMYLQILEFPGGGTEFLVARRDYKIKHHKESLWYKILENVGRIFSVGRLGLRYLIDSAKSRRNKK